MIQGANTWMITLDIPGQEESGAMVMLGSVGLFHLLTNGVYCSCTNLLLTSWDIQAGEIVMLLFFCEYIKRSWGLPFKTL